MKKLLAIVLLLPLAAFSQIRFKKGYFIDNTGNKKECFIRDKGWNNNPTSFEYRASAESETLQATIENTAEFAIEGEVKYVRATVAMEQSSAKLGSLQQNAQYTLNEETIFLKSVVESIHSLYMYEQTGLLKFFDRKPSGEFSQLIYIVWLEKGTILRKYNSYQGQLLNEFACPGATLASVSKLEYTIESLAEYYKETSECNGRKILEISKERNKGDLNLRPFVGFKNVKFSTDPGMDTYPALSTTNSCVAYGLEIEYILPTNGKKWAVLLSAEHNSVKKKGDLPDGIGLDDKRYEIDYSAFQVPAGCRYYSFVSEDLKFFATATLVLNFVNKKSRVTYTTGNTSTSWAMEGSSFSAGIGVGLSYKKVNAEIRYYTPQALYRDTDGQVNKIAFTVSYPIF